MSHYRVLGVEPDATPEAIRRAYLRLAREHHPDRHASDGSPAGRRQAEDRMREVNAAWAVLGDPVRRSAYDSASSGTPDPPAGGATVTRPSADFSPLYEHDEDDDDSWRYEPDEFDPRTSIGRTLSMGPPLLLFAGAALFALSLVIGARALVAAAAACLLLAGLLFLGAPIVAVFRSRSNEQDHGAGER